MGESVHGDGTTRVPADALVDVDADMLKQLRYLPLLEATAMRQTFIQQNIEDDQVTRICMSIIICSQLYLDK